MPLPKVLQTLSTKGKIAVGGALLAVLVVGYLMFSLASTPGYTTIVSGLDPADTGKMTAALDEKGVSYELQNNGTALAVVKKDVGPARIALAESGGVAGGVQPGFELFDKQKMGSSQMQQQVTYQRAVEGELARTIGQIQGVSGASVQLVLPDENDALLNEDAPEATAAVLLTGSTDPDPAAVQGIARLVASSVKALKPQKVTITDGSGRLLWPAGDGGAAGGAQLAKQTAALKYQRTMEASLTSVLAQTVGADKARVRVNADIDADQAQQEQLKYGKRSVALKETTEKEQMDGGSGATGGTAGAAGNVPGYASAGTSTGGKSKYEKDSGDREFGVDKTVTRRTIAAGGVTKQSVAVMVSDAVPAAQIPAIKSAISAAAGIDTTRGDQLSVSRMAFAKPPAVAAGPAIPPGLLGNLKWGALGLGLIAFFVLIGRHLRRREQEALASPVWLTEIEAPRSLRDLEAERAAAQARLAAQPALERPGSRTRMEDLADQDPGAVATQVRHWMTED
ncbi:flagellar basal-body MS-ring/collar protein FliF [Patulibacter sp. NPDC049589]|uniref:flagellar basal-body MS-ring/collar protein FliF n=1 Tax=Patulibacter sp. NPDC049589 TaxID=3154731 RepID=UPI00342E7D8B